MKIVTKYNPIPHRALIEYHKSSIFKLELLKSAQKGEHIYQNQVNLLDNCKYARELNHKFNIKDLFVNYWTKFFDKHKHLLTREAVIENVEAMIHCKDLSKGYLFLNVLIVIIFMFKDYHVTLDFVQVAVKNIEKNELLKFKRNF